ncbi:MAG: zinc-binding dehydrogenase [Bacteroidota bacterium]
MKAFLITKFGSPSVLKISEVPERALEDREVRVAVRFIGLNFAEVFARLGIYPGIPDPPFIPGIEFSGIVKETGVGVRAFKPGERVMGFCRQGSYAESVCVHEDHLVKIPRRMSLSEAAAFPVAFLSAFHGLVTLAHARRGEKLLLHAAAGGVGLAAIQIARHLGLEIFATAGSQEKLLAAEREGAHHVINYRSEDFTVLVKRDTGGYGVDVVLDSVGGSIFRKSWKLLAPMGRYVLYGFASVTGKGGLNRLKMIKEAVQVPLIYPPSIVSRNVSLMGFNLYFLTHKVQYFKGATKQLLSWYDKKIITPRIGTTFPFAEIPRAHEFLQSRKSIGKVVVEVPYT